MTKSLVTGGTGFIGAHLIKLLLERGHTVHTTVRSVSNKSKNQCLTDLQTAYPDRLFLFEADLLKSGTFTNAMKGCEVVYHVASPFMTPQQIKDGMKQIVEPAINGTKNVLNSVNEVDSVRRVVLTSSSMSTSRYKPLYQS
jgi:dihydroflavonol-4-reductase